MKTRKEEYKFNNSDFMKKMQANYNIDAYSASLQHSNRIFNNLYGFKGRKVPSHAPILIDKEIMMKLQGKLEKEFEITEKNRIRSENDLQFSFTYYHFLMSEAEKLNVEQIFNEIDTDDSG